jgi:hypothetical protein
MARLAVEWHGEGYEALPDAWFVWGTIKHSYINYKATPPAEHVETWQFFRLRIPWLQWKDLKWAREAHDCGDPMNWPQIGWHRPEISSRRRSSFAAREWHLHWIPVKTWPVR